MRNKDLLKIKPGDIVLTTEGVIVIDEDGLQFEQNRHNDYYSFYDTNGNYYVEDEFIKIMHDNSFESNKPELIHLIKKFDRYMIKNEKLINTSLGEVSSNYGYEVVEIQKLDKDFYIIVAAMKERSVLKNDELKMGDNAIFYISNDNIYTYEEWQNKCKQSEEEYDY